MTKEAGSGSKLGSD